MLSEGKETILVGGCKQGESLVYNNKPSYRQGTPYIIHDGLTFSILMIAS